MKTYRLNNGTEIPVIGFGTYKATGEAAASAVVDAVHAGYRLIDTAAFYGNEQGVGEGIRSCGVPREQLFITSKVWRTDRGYEKTKAAFQKTLANLGLDYLDLYLIHWPASSSVYPDWEDINLGTWRAMTELYHEGKIRAIGVSNFKPHHLKALMETEVQPMVDQIELHPGQNQEETTAYCRKNHILTEAWSPLGRGRIFQDETLLAIAEKYGKSLPQISLRWELQHGYLPIPKSVRPERIRENLDVFSFELSDEDMAAIDALPPFGSSGEDPDTFEL